MTPSLVPRPFYVRGASWERNKGLVPFVRACVEFYRVNSKELTSRILCLAINKSQKRECNMLTSQCKALKSLKERKNIVIFES